jgi:hypothetical protein
VRKLIWVEKGWENYGDFIVIENGGSLKWLEFFVLLAMFYDGFSGSEVFRW